MKKREIRTEATGSAMGTTGRQDIVRIALVDKPTTFNPLAVNTIWDKAVLNLLYDCLAVSSSKEPYSPEPWLANKWEWGKEGRQLRVVLKDNVKWHDGTPLTAEDVRFTFELIKEFALPKFLGNTYFIDEVRVINDASVEFELSEPRATFIPVTLCHIPILPVHLWKSIAEKARASDVPAEVLVQYPNDAPVGTGPFKFGKHVEGESIRLEANEEYFAGSPGVAGILFKVHRVEGMTEHRYLDDYASQERALLALKDGDCDYVACHYPIYALLGFHKNPEPNITVALNPVNGVEYLAFNCRRRPFDDGAFRDAIACLIDREEFCKHIFMGQSMPIYSAVPAWATDWANPNVARNGDSLSVERRQEKAKKILTDAGYVWRNGRILMPNKEPFRELSISADCRIMRRISLSTELSLRLREIGVPVSMQARPPEEIRSLEQGLDHDFDMMISEFWFYLPLDPDYLAAFFHSSQAERGLNSAGYENPEFDSLAILQRQELDPEKRKDIVWKMQDILAEDKPWIPLISNMRIEFYRNDTFQGWVNRPNGYPSYFQVWSYLNLSRA